MEKLLGMYTMAQQILYTLKPRANTAVTDTQISNEVKLSFFLGWCRYTGFQVVTSNIKIAIGILEGRHEKLNWD